jgi:hypothetical protein
MKKKVAKYGLLLICGIAGYVAGNMGASDIIQKEQVVKEVIKYKTIDRVITKPDGTKIVEIIKEVDKSKDSSTKVKYDTRKRLVSVYAGCDSILRCKPIYGIGYSKKLIAGLYGGVYARTDKEVGLVLTYSF